MLPTELYEFEGSVWSNVPKLALEEGGLKKDKDVKWISVNLPEVCIFSQTVLVFSRDTKVISLFRVRTSSQATSRSTLLVLCPLWLLAMTLSQTPRWVVIILVQTTFHPCKKLWHLWEPGWMAELSMLQFEKGIHADLHYGRCFLRARSPKLSRLLLKSLRARGFPPAVVSLRRYVQK